MNANKSYSLHRELAKANIHKALKALIAKNLIFRLPSKLLFLIKAIENKKKKIREREAFSLAGKAINYNALRQN